MDNSDRLKLALELGELRAPRRGRQKPLSLAQLAEDIRKVTGHKLDRTVLARFLANPEHPRATTVSTLRQFVAAKRRKKAA